MCPIHKWCRCTQISDGCTFPRCQVFWRFKTVQNGSNVSFHLRSCLDWAGCEVLNCYYPSCLSQKLKSLKSLSCETSFGRYTPKDCFVVKNFFTVELWHVTPHWLLTFLWTSGNQGSLWVFLSMRENRIFQIIQIRLQMVSSKAYAKACPQFHWHKHIRPAKQHDIPGC